MVPSSKVGSSQLGTPVPGLSNARVRAQGLWGGSPRPPGVNACRHEGTNLTTCPKFENLGFRV